MRQGLKSRIFDTINKYKNNMLKLSFHNIVLFIIFTSIVFMPFIGIIHYDNIDCQINKVHASGYWVYNQTKTYTWDFNNASGNSKTTPYGNWSSLLDNPTYYFTYETWPTYGATGKDLSIIYTGAKYFGSNADAHWQAINTSVTQFSGYMPSRNFTFPSGFKNATIYFYTYMPGGINENNHQDGVQTAYMSGSNHIKTYTLHTTAGVADSHDAFVKSNTYNFTLGVTNAIGNGTYTVEIFLGYLYYFPGLLQWRHEAAVYDQFVMTYWYGVWVDTTPSSPTLTIDPIYTQWIGTGLFLSGFIMFGLPIIVIAYKARERELSIRTLILLLTVVLVGFFFLISIGDLI